MADTPNLPEGVHIPSWFRRYIEATAPNGNVEPEAPTPPVGAPAVPHVVGNFTKLCKDFSDLGGKTLAGTETFVEARAWLRETEPIFRFDRAWRC